MADRAPAGGQGRDARLRQRANRERHRQVAALPFAHPARSQFIIERQRRQRKMTAAVEISRQR